MNRQRKNGRFSWLFEEWVVHFGLTVVIVVAVVDGAMLVNGHGLI